MQAFRDVVTVKDNLIRVMLPTSFKTEKVEVIVLPIEECKEPHELRNSERFSGVISKETAGKIHKHINEIRNEWERDIC